ncbi:MKI67 FHA domain-interacting nucleolar phosphoprotein-like [Artemia franciscana]
MDSISQNKNAAKDFLSIRTVGGTQKEKETMSKMLKDVREKLQKKGRGLKKRQTYKGAIYLGHIPHGFYEEEMHKFFSQFGNIEKIRLARSERTGKSKGYAFVQFKDDRVAKIAAEAMNNYLMFHKILKCSYIAPKKENENLFKRAFTKETDCRIAKKRQTMFKKLNKEMTPKQQKNFKARTLRKIKQTLAALSSMGITYSPVIYDPDISAEKDHQIQDNDVSTEEKHDIEDKIPNSENQELNNVQNLTTSSSLAEKKLGKSAQKKKRNLDVTKKSGSQTPGRNFEQKKSKSLRKSGKIRKSL